jgi:tRNA (adenine22-N1)-methyltransferase
MIPRGHRVADIGADHARLPVYLLERGITETVIATDNSPGPLERAAQTLRKHRLEGRVELRLGDGALTLSPGEIDTAVIAGMGGDSVLEILEASPWLTGKNLIVQPMTKQEKIERLGFLEKAEVCEGRRRYIIFRMGGRGNG